ncbi:helix-turn-helix transcriptional regulator [Alishewanella longhuensis]
MQLNTTLIRQLRADKGWTQQQLADICNLSLRTIQRVELHGIASLETSKALAVAFAIERQQLQQEDPIAEQQAGHYAVPVWVPAVTFIAGLLVGPLLLFILNR